MEGPPSSSTSAISPTPPLAEPSDVEKRSHKRKLQNSCSNLNCSSPSTELVIAKKAASIYYQLNTDFKKVYKICTACNQEAEEYLLNSVNALKNHQPVFQYKPKPMPMSSSDDVEIVEVKEDDEDDDPREIQILQDEANQKVKVVGNINAIVSEVMKNVSLQENLRKCEELAFLEADCLGEDFALMDQQIREVESQIHENKKLYNMITGNHQAPPFILEEVDISENGSIEKTPCLNEHLKNLPANITAMIAAASDAAAADGGGSRRKQDIRNRNCTDDDEIMEVDAPESRNCPLGKPLKGIPKVSPFPGDIVYAQSSTVFHPWLKASIVDPVRTGRQGQEAEYIIRFEDQTRTPRQQVKQVTAKQIAFSKPFQRTLVVGTRIVAKLIVESEPEPTEDKVYAGIVAEAPSYANKNRHLVFFDAGVAQYVHYEDVFLVYGRSKEAWADVYQDSADFIKNYLAKYPEREMVRLSLGQVIRTEWNGKWEAARVVELDCSLVKMETDKRQRQEWLYRGSNRLFPLFEKESRQQQTTTRTRNRAARRHTNRNISRIEYNYDDGPDESTTSTKAHQVPEEKNATCRRRIAHNDYQEHEGTIVKRPIPESAPKTKEYEPHECSHACVYDHDENNKEFRKMSPLAILLHLGFSRKVAKTKRTVLYRGPCGALIMDLEEMYDYLTQTNCNIPIDHFCFDFAVDCINEFKQSRQLCFLADLTEGRETVPVQVVNCFTQEYPPYMEYRSQRVAGAGVNFNTDPEFLVGCDCEDDCRDKSKCSCWQMTLSGLSFTKLSPQEDPYKGYEYRRLKHPILSGIYECNPRCKCAKTCCNRVAQAGMKVPLQVFKTYARGWGIRTLFDIPKGAFICVYAGQVLTDQGANEDGLQFGDEYFADLDFMECIENKKADYESDVTDIEAEDEPGKRSGKRKQQRKQKEMEEKEDDCANFRIRLELSGNKEKAVNTRQKNNADGTDEERNTEEDDGGTKPRSHFNANMENAQLERTTRRPTREYFCDGEDCYTIDAKITGNIGRYFNHSCQPNLFVQNVFVDTHDLRFPWVAFFATKHIKAGSELTWDYNYEVDSVPNKVLYCYCGSVECRGRLL